MGTMEVFEFPEDDRPSVLTGNLCEHFGGCLECPGFTTAGELQVPDKTQMKRCFATIGVIAARSIHRFCLRLARYYFFEKPA